MIICYTQVDNLTKVVARPMSALKLLIEDSMRRQKIRSARALAVQSGAHYATVSKILRGETKIPDLETLARLAWALDLNTLILRRQIAMPRYSMSIGFESTPIHDITLMKHSIYVCAKTKE